MAIATANDYFLPVTCDDVCVYAAYKQQRRCYGRTEVIDAGFDCFSAYNERLLEISKQSASASTRVVAVSICRYLHLHKLRLTVCPYVLKSILLSLCNMCFYIRSAVIYVDLKWLRDKPIR